MACAACAVCVYVFTCRCVHVVGYAYIADCTLGQQHRFQLQHRFNITSAPFLYVDFLAAVCLRPAQCWLGALIRVHRLSKGQRERRITRCCFTIEPCEDGVIGTALVVAVREILADQATHPVGEAGTTVERQARSIIWQRTG